MKLVFYVLSSGKTEAYIEFCGVCVLLYIQYVIMVRLKMCASVGIGLDQVWNICVVD